MSSCDLNPEHHVNVDLIKNGRWLTGVQQRFCYGSSWTYTIL